MTVHCVILVLKTKAHLLFTYQIGVPVQDKTATSRETRYKGCLR